MGPASANAAWTTSGKRLNINQDEPEPPLENGLDRPKCFDDGPAWTAGHKPAPNSLIGAGPLRRGRSASIPRRRRPLQSLPASPVQPAAFARWFVAGWIIREEFGELVVHDLEVRHILQVHIALEHIVSRCSPLLQYRVGRCSRSGSSAREHPPSRRRHRPHPKATCPAVKT